MRGDDRLIMSLRDYIDSVAPAPNWLKDAQADASSKGLDKLKLRDINRVIAEVRNRARKTRTRKHKDLSVNRRPAPPGKAN